MKNGFLPFILFALLSLTACVEGETIESVEELPTNHIIDNAEIGEVNDGRHSDSELEKPLIWLDTMTESDLEKNTQSCAGHMKFDKCIIVCQITPDKPKKFRTLMLPVLALVSHLERRDAKHDSRDFVGRCSDGLELGPDDNDTINYCDPQLSSFDCL